MSFARNKQPNRRSKKNLDGQFEVLASGSLVKRTDQFKSVIREPGKLEVTVRNNDIATFATHDERKTNLTEYINRRGPRVYEKSTEAKILSHPKEYTRIQKGNRKMKHLKRDMASGVSSNRSNIVCALRVRMPKVLPNLVPPESPSQPETNSGQKILASEVIIAPPPTNQRPELKLPSTSAPTEALHQVLLRSNKRTRTSPKYYGYEKDDSSGESTNSCPPNFIQPSSKRRAGYVDSVQLLVIQTIVDTVAQVEPIPNTFPSPVIGEVSPTEPRICPANQSPPEEFIIDEEDKQT